MTVLKRFAFLLPLMVLPFAPAIGQAGAELVLTMTVQQGQTP